MEWSPSTYAMKIKTILLITAFTIHGLVGIVSFTRWYRERVRVDPKAVVNYTKSISVIALVPDKEAWEASLMMKNVSDKPIIAFATWNLNENSPGSNRSFYHIDPIKPGTVFRYPYGGRGLGKIHASLLKVECAILEGGVIDGSRERGNEMLEFLQKLRNQKE